MPDRKHPYIRVQSQVGQRASPALYEHLEEAVKRGESPSLVMRSLAEEALMLRNHPIIGALKSVDFKGEKSPHLPLSGNPILEQREGAFQYTGDKKRNSSDTQQPPRPPSGGSAPRRDGGSAMAALVVQRGLEPEQRRR